MLYLSLVYYAMLCELAITFALCIPNIRVQCYIAFLISKISQNKYMFMLICIYYFYVLIIFFDSYIEMNKYNSLKDITYENINVNVVTHDYHNAKLFRAQRNVYLTSFTLFTGLMINRIHTLIQKNTLLSEKKSS